MSEEDKTDENEEETPEEEETEEESIGIQPRIAIQPPEELGDADMLMPLVDIYMQERGLSDRSQAVAKLVSALSQVGYKPTKEIRNIREYINNMSEILNQIPDTDESLAVKGAIGSDMALTSSKLLKNKYMGDNELDDMMRYAMRMGIVFKMIDNVFSGARKENSGNNVKEMPEWAKSLKEDVKSLKEEKEQNKLLEAIEAKISPVVEKVDKLEEAMKAFKEKPSKEEETNVVEAIKDLKDTLTKDKIDELKESIDALPEKIGSGIGGGGGGIDDVEKVVSKIANIKTSLDKIYGKGGGGGETADWKAMAIQEFGETVREVLPKLASGEEEEEEGKSSEVSIEDAIDRKVLEYAINAQTYGNGAIYWDKCAKHLGLTPEQVYASVQRLIKKGVLKGAKFIKPEKPKAEEKPKPKPKPKKKQSKEKGEDIGKKKGKEWQGEV